MEGFLVFFFILGFVFGLVFMMATIYYMNKKEGNL